MDSNTQVLTSEYGVMKAILSELPSLHLNKAATVCKAWNETATIIKKSRHQIYNTSNSESFEDHSKIKTLIQLIKSQPSVCIIFLTNQNLGELPPELALSPLPGVPQFGRCTEYRVLRYLRKSLPKNCLIAGGITPGAIVTDNVTLHTTEVEDGDAFGLFFIPVLPDVMLTNFYIGRKKMKEVGVVNLF